MDLKFEAYLELVRERFRKNETEKFCKFLGVLREFCSQKIGAAEILPRMNELLIRHPDLITGFVKFMPEEYRVTVAVLPPVLKKKRIDKMKKEMVVNMIGKKMKRRMFKLEEARKFLDKVKVNTLYRGQGHVYNAFKRTLRKGEKKSIGEIVGAILKEHPELYKEFTTTYVVTKPEKKSVIHKSRTFKGGVRIISAYEKRAFALEDEKNDYDVVFEALKSTAKRVGRLIMKQRVGTALMDGCDGEELSAVNLRYIEKLYGDYGQEVVDHLRANPKTALQIIFRRLWQKVFEMEEYRFGVEERLRRGLA